MARILEGSTGNKPTPEEAASFFAEIDRFEQDKERKLADLDAEFKRRKREIISAVKSDQDAILDDAKEKGVAKKVLRALVNGARGVRKAEENLTAKQARAEEFVNDLEDDDKTYAISIRAALGRFAESPLGQAAMAREANGKQPDAAGIAAVMEQQDAKASRRRGAAKH